MVPRHKSDSATTETRVGTSLAAFENQRDVIVTRKRITGVNSEPNKRTDESPNYDEEAAAIHRRTQINDKVMNRKGLRLTKWNLTSHRRLVKQPTQYAYMSRTRTAHHTRDPSPTNPKQPLTSTKRRRALTTPLRLAAPTVEAARH